MKLRLAAVALMLAGCSSLFDRFEDQGEKVAELAPLEASASVQAVWQASAGSSGMQVLVPALAEGTVYVAAADGQISRLDAASGKTLWRIEAKQPVTGGVGAADNLVLVGTAKGDVLAFDANGKTLWQSHLSSEVLSPPQVADGVVVVRSNDGYVYGLDAASGARIWLYQRATPALTIRAHVGVTVAHGMVYVGFAGGKLAALELANGNLLWEVTVAQPSGATELERVTDITSLPLVDNAQVCAVAYQGRLACFERSNGNLLWAREVSSIAGMAADARNLYVVDNKSALLAFDRQSGASVWKQDRLATRKVGTPAVFGKYLVAGDIRGYVHFINREDGMLAARFATDGGALSAAPIVLGQRVLLQTGSGGVYALALK